MFKCLIINICAAYRHEKKNNNFPQSVISCTIGFCITLFYKKWPSLVVPI